MPKQNISWGKAFGIGIVGSLLFKTMEYIIQWELTFLGGTPFILLKTIVLQLIFLLVASSIIIVIFKSTNLKKWSYMLVPVLYRVMASVSNLIFTKGNLKVLLIDNVEAITFGLMAGYIAFNLFNYNKK